MPKLTPNFPCRLEFMVDYETRLSLISLGFLTGSGKSYARIARSLLKQAIDTAVENLEPKRRKAYEEILANMKIAEPAPKV